VQTFIGGGITGGILYRTTDGGSSWANISDNLPTVPANSVVVDPQDAKTVYVALDIGVYATRDVYVAARRYDSAPFEKMRSWVTGAFGSSVSNHGGKYRRISAEHHWNHHYEEWQYYQH
jgi:hypothetical protein